MAVAGEAGDAAVCDVVDLRTAACELDCANTATRVCATPRAVPDAPELVELLSLIHI